MNHVGKVAASRQRTVGYAGRRLGQTFSTFINGPSLLLDMARRARHLTFRTRTGLSITVPNVAGARFPAYEIHGDDVYRMDELVQQLPADAVALDFGAHVGNFSLRLAHLLPQATVHAFEALPTTAAFLERNIRANRLSERVVAHTVALAASRGELSLTDNAHASARNGLTAPAGSGRSVLVPSIGFADAKTRAGGRVDVVKLDIEGAEYDVILGSATADWATVSVVVMEYHPVPGRSLSDIAAKLSAGGLELEREQPIRPGLGTAWFRRPS